MELGLREQFLERAVGDSEPPRPSRSLLVRSSRSAARTLIRRIAWPMSVVGVWLTGPQVFENRVDLGQPGVELAPPPRRTDRGLS